MSKKQEVMTLLRETFGEQISGLEEKVSALINLPANKRTILEFPKTRRKLRDGEVLVLKHGERFQDLPREKTLPDGISADDLSIGRMIKGMVTGNWAGSEAEKAALVEGTDSLGGFLVPEPLSDRVIDLVRNKSRVIQAGALTVPMSSQTLVLARLDADPTGYWRAESAAITESDLTFAAVTLTAKALGALVRVSIELLEDAANAEQVIEDALAAALALELDRVCLVGSGSGAEPQGIYGASSIQEISMGTNGAALADYDEFSQAIQKLMEKNETGPFGCIFAPRTWGALDVLKDTTNQPLRPPPSYEDLKKYDSMQVPIDQTQGTASDASTAFFGGWQNVLIGSRRQVVIEASRVAEDAFSQMQVLIRAYLRADVQLARADHLVRIVGIIP